MNYGIYVQSFDGTLLLAAPSVGTTVSITGTATWTGTTDASGYAKDINGSPSLPYGSYTVVASKYGFNSDQKDFTVPLVGNINLTITQIKQTVEVIVSE